MRRGASLRAAWANTSYGNSSLRRSAPGGNTALELTITGKAQSADDVALQEALRERGQIPEHIAIIMDGNGRWARQRGENRVLGHHEGVESVRDITEACA